MRILERYIIRNIILYFLVCLFTFMFLYVIIDIFSHLEEILQQKVPYLTLGQYYLANLPLVFVHVSPFSCLLAVLITFSHLNRDNEVIAMRASGLSIYQMVKVVLVFGMTVSILYFLVNNKLVPYSMAVTEQVKAQMESSNAQPEPKKEEILNLAVFGLKNRLFFVNRFTPHNGTMEGINILEHDPDQNVIRKVVANRGEYRNGMWVFFQSMTTELDQNGLVVNGPVYLEEEVMSIPETPQEFSHQRRLPEQMSIDQLRSYIDKLSDSGATGTLQKFKVELYRRFTSSITPLVIILLAIPFSLMVKKRATGLYALGISIIGGFLYYGINAISTALGYAGILPAWIATTFSHVLVITSSLYLIRSLP